MFKIWKDIFFFERGTGTSFIEVMEEHIWASLDEQVGLSMNKGINYLRRSSCIIGSLIFRCYMKLFVHDQFQTPHWS